MANLRCLLVLCWILYVSTNSEDFSIGETDDCCSKCDCMNSLPHFDEIDCSSRSLTEVPNCPWENITRVNLRENKIQKISKETFQRFKYIHDLDLGKNNLSSLPDPSILMVNLIDLNLDGNSFSAVPTTVLSKMLNLKILYMTDNNIHEIDDFWVQKKLQILELDRNKIKKFPRFGPKMMPKLMELSLRENQIREIPENALQNTKMLETLLLRQNEIKSVHPGFLGNNTDSLRYLELDKNNLTKFPRFGPKMMAKFKKLSLRENQIEEIPENAFENIKMLESLDLSMNQELATFGSIKNLTNLKHLHISKTNIRDIPNFAFQGLNNLEVIDLSESMSEKEHNTGKQAFANLPHLTILFLSHFKLKHFPNLTGSYGLKRLYLKGNQIEEMPRNICEILPNLTDLDVSSNELKALPSQLRCEELVLLYVHDNQLTALPSLSGCTKLAVLVVDSNRIQSFGDSVRGLNSLKDISAKFNRIESIEENDFKGLTQLEKLLLKDNAISNIHEKAFSDLTNLKDLILTDNNFPELPTLGLTTVETISIKGNSKLIKFPSPRHLPNIKTLHLYYPYHCCAFLTNAKKELYNTTLIEGHQATWIWMAHDVPENFTFDETDSSAYFQQDDHTPDEDIPDKIKCTPEPDPFFPCEDLMGDWVLRCGVWIVFVLAVCGNATVIIVILASHTKMDVSRFLISNLAFADLFMGIYLGFLAVVDVSTLGNFKSYGVEWQMSSGCRTAGFLATLSSELSVFTLTVITLERYIAIKNAIRVNRKLQLKTAIIVMIFGWVFALATATLPLLEVNSYGKFCVCLPFETDDKKSIVFLVFLLCLNAAAFIVILFCYILMYCSIRGSNAWNASDFRVAKRMALLVFTDFACWAPIVFFSLTATFGSSIINLSQAKIFTVFVFPLNSCANPFLYAIFTSHFKKDLLAICRRVEDKYPFLKITKQRVSFSRRSSCSGAISENPNLYLRVRRFSLPVFARGFNNSITTNGRGSDSLNSNKISSDTNAIGHDCNEHLLTERVTSV